MNTLRVNTILSTDKMIKKAVSLFTVLLFGLMAFAQIPDTPEKPNFQTSVYDEAALLNPVEKQSLEQKLIQYADSTSTQIVVATVESLNGEEIGYYATHWAHKWGIGQEGKDNGVLILLSKNDRKVTIRTGYGMEHLLTDALSRRIIENVMIPEFRNGNFYAGFNNATDVMFDIFAGEYQNDQTGEEDFSLAPFIIMLIIFIILIILISKRANNSGGTGGKRFADDDIFGPIILSRGGRGGWGTGGFGGGWGSGSGGGFGGGGFGGGFGGGGFGGGGASGGW